MRRIERALDKAGILKVLDTCKVLRLGMCQEQQPYIVPLNYGYEMAGSSLILYCHCANEGKKLDILRQNSNVCFEMDCNGRLKDGEEACSHSYFYASVIGNGIVEFLEEAEEKRKALAVLMRHMTGKDFSFFSKAALASVTVMRIQSDHYSGKANPSAVI